MDNLFIKISEVEKVATVSLDKDPTTWIKSVVTAFLTDYPMLQNTPISVTWKKKDTNKGYAIGTLNVLNGAVPIIIKNLQLSPLDVIMFGGMTLPLTPDTIQELITSPSPFKGVQLEQPKTSLTVFENSMISPTSGNYSFTDTKYTVRDAVKVASYNSFIDKIGYVNSKDVENILNTINSNENIKQNFIDNNTVSVLEKLASKGTISVDSELESFARNLEIDRQYLYEDEDGNIILKQASSALDMSWETQLETHESIGLENIYKEQVIEKTANVDNEVEQVNDYSKIPEIGDKGYFTNGNYTSPVVEIISIKKNQPLQKFAFFKFMNNTGGIIVNEKNDYQIVDKFSFEKVASNLSVKGSNINLDDYGFFAIDDYAITKPFKISGIQKVANDGNFEIFADHGLEYKYYYPILLKGNNLIPHETNKLASYVPGNAKFIKLSNAIYDTELQQKFNELTKTASNVNSITIEALNGLEKISFVIINDTVDNVTTKGNITYISGVCDFKIPSLTKTASVKIKQNNYVYRDNVGLYRLAGDEFVKEANQNKNFKLANLNKHEAIWNSILLGASKEDVEKIASLQKGMSYKIKNELEVPTSAERLVKTAEAVIDNKLGEHLKAIPLLVKEASFISNKTTVDAVLSLGLMNKYNILEFVALIPDYERVAGELAKLLIMTRLGLSSLPEQVVKTAMESLTSVIFTLKRINSLAKNEDK